MFYSQSDKTYWDRAFQLLYCTTTSPPTLLAIYQCGLLEISLSTDLGNIAEGRGLQEASSLNYQSTKLKESPARDPLGVEGF